VFFFEELPLPQRPLFSPPSHFLLDCTNPSLRKFLSPPPLITECLSTFPAPSLIGGFLFFAIPSNYSDRAPFLAQITFSLNVLTPMPFFLFLLLEDAEAPPFVAHLFRLAGLPDLAERCSFLAVRHSARVFLNRTGLMFHVSAFPKNRNPSSRDPRLCSRLSPFFF